MNKFNKFLVVLNLAIVGLGCGEDYDLTTQPQPPVGVPPDVHGSPPDAGMPAMGVPVYEGTESAGALHVESDVPLTMGQMLALKRGFERRQTADVSLPEVEQVSSAIILGGMRQTPEQQQGEVVVNRWNHTQDEPWYPNGNYPNNSLILSPNWSWPNLASSGATWPSGAVMDNNIFRAAYFVPPGKCVGWKPYADANYVNQYVFLGNAVCKTPSQLGENWLLWNNGWSITGMKTALSNCLPGSCSLPPGF